MSESADLAKQAIGRLNHAGALLKASALESQNLDAARTFWEMALRAEGMARTIRESTGSEKEAAK